MSVHTRESTVILERTVVYANGIRIMSANKGHATIAFWAELGAFAEINSLSI